MNTPETPYEATVLALTLALTAQTEAQVFKCVKMADSFGLTKDEMKRAKVAAVTASYQDIKIWSEE
tara:strand:- start:183 stop:380 length:198 start_codon:yes stop_codon:yes gene_type:complete